MGKLSKRQKQVFHALRNGVKVWTVSADLDEWDEDPNESIVLAHFDENELAGLAYTEPLQFRTLFALVRAGLVDVDGDDWNSARVV